MKRIIAFLITLLLIMSSVHISYAADTSEIAVNETLDAQNVEWLKTLGISAEIKSDSVTRGEFVLALIKMMNLETTGASKIIFSDVDKNSDLGGALETAVSIGLISAADKFEPDRAITYNEACKIAVCALGYDVNAKIYGGYPYGYVTVASKLNLTYGSEAGVLSKSDFVEFMTLMSHSIIRDIAGISSVDGELYINYESGERFIEKYRNYKEFDGIVEANEFTHIYSSNKKSNENQIVIGETSYDADFNDYDLGTYVYGYTDEDDNIVYSWLGENNITRVFSVQYPRYENGYLYYEEADKEKRISLPNDGATLLNGQSAIVTSNDYALTDGYIELIDNDSDSKIDVISVYKSEFIKISGFSVANEFIRDANTGTVISLKDKKYSFNGVDFSTLKKDMILEYFKSPDGMYYEFHLCPVVATGEITMLGTDNGTVYLNDIPYETTDYFNTWYKELVKLGSNVKAYSSLDGKIVCVELVSQSSMKYAYYYDCKYNDKSLDKSYLMRMYTEDGEIKTFKLDDKVIYNGNSQNADTVYSTMQAQKETLIRFQAKDDTLTKIVTDNGDGSFYNPSSDGIDILKRYHYKGYDSTTDKIPYVTGYFVPYFFVGSDTVVFAIKSSDKESDETKRFSVGTGSGFLGGMNDPIKNQLSAYNVSKDGYAGVILYNDDGSRDSYLGTLTAPHAIVNSVMKTLDSEGEEIYCISLYWNDNYFDLYVEPDASFINSDSFRNGYSDGEIPFTVGDYIRYNYSENTLVYASKAYCARTDTLLAVQKYHDSELNFYYGNLTGVSDSACSLLITKDDNHIGSECYYPITSTITVVKSGEYVVNRPAYELAGYVDNPDCKGVMVSCSNSTTKTIVVYE